MRMCYKLILIYDGLHFNEFSVIATVCIDLSGIHIYIVSSEGSAGVTPYFRMLNMYYIRI